MNDNIVIETKLGQLVFTKYEDGDFKGVRVQLNGNILTLIEEDSSKEVIRAVVYEKESEEPSFVVDLADNK